MKKKLIKIITILSLCYSIFSTFLINGAVITFFLRLQDQEEISENFLKHGSINNLNNLLNKTIAGVPICYSGFITFSGHHGLVTLPKKSLDKDIEVLITKSMKPIFMKNTNTIKSFELLDIKQASLYKLNKKMEYSNLVWQIKKIAVEKDSIKDKTIIIYANHQNVKPLAMHVKAIDSINDIVLPDFTINKDENVALDSLDAMKIEQYFSLVTNKIKQISLGYSLKLK